MRPETMRVTWTHPGLAALLEAAERDPRILDCPDCVEAFLRDWEDRP